MASDTMDAPVLADLQELTNISSILTIDVVWGTCRERRMIGSGGERERERERVRERIRKSVLSVRLGDVDDEDNEKIITYSLVTL